MEEIIIRNATIVDIDFLVEAITEATKSGTNKFSYSTIFDLSEEEVKKYIAKMLLEEVDGCDLSISSFLLGEINYKPIAAICVWIEGLEGIPSAILKANLINATLPKENIEKSRLVMPVIKELHIECYPNTIQVGYIYISKEYRGRMLGSMLLRKKIEQLTYIRPDITEAYAQIFEGNIPSIRVAERSNFKQILKKVSLNKDIIQYFPYNTMVLLKKELNTNK